jgi:putative SOS response-associated peptidase YedK
MCNRYKFNLPLERLAEDFSSIKIPLRFAPDARASNGDTAISDMAPIVRMADEETAQVDMLRWSWPASPTNKRPVFNYVSEGRRQPRENRCLIPANGFYEYTAPADPKKKTKDRWLFTRPTGEIFGIAGKWIWDPITDEPRWAMLTTEPGPDIVAIHDRQIVILTRDQWAPWLLGGEERELLKPSPAGTLVVARDS